MVLRNKKVNKTASFHEGGEDAVGSKSVSTDLKKCVFHYGKKGGPWAA